MGVAPGLGDSLILGIHFNSFSTAEAIATSRVVSCWDLRSPIIYSHVQNKRAWYCARGAPQTVHGPFCIYTTTEASDFKFGTQLGVATAYQKIKSKKWVFYKV